MNDLFIILGFKGASRPSFLFEYIAKQKQKQKIRELRKKNHGFSKIEFVRCKLFLNSIIHKLSLGSREVPQKMGPDRFSRFDIHWIQTNRHPDKQSILKKDSLFL